MNWATRRRVIYAVTTVVTLIAVFLYLYRDTLFPAPTCFDNKMNGYETGVDCGGTCSLMCTQEITPLVVEWSQALQTSSSTYDLVALVSNKNINNAPQFVAYRFIVYDKQGKEIIKKEGKTIVPVNSDFPVIIQNVFTNLVPDHMVTVLSYEKHYKTFEKPTKPTIKILNTSFENTSIPKAYVTIKNTKFSSIKNIPVRIVLYDINQNAIGAGETFVGEMKAEEQKDLVFTWYYPFLTPFPNIIVYPIMNPFVSSN